MSSSPAPCIFCNHTESQFTYSCEDIFGDAYEVRTCNSCEAIFLSPHPTMEQLARAYDDSYYGEGEEKFEGPVEKALNVFRDQRASNLAKRLEKKGRVLDIGCGNGNFLAALGKRGDFELNGIELEGGSAERARRVPNLKLKIGMLEWEDYAENSMDAITLFHVFEHLTEPKKNLEIISKILKKGGYLVMSFPNIGSFQARKFKGDWLHLDPPRHLFFFKNKRFRSLMEEHGFEVIVEKHFSPEYNPFGFQQSLLNRWLGKREVLYEYLKGNKSYTQSHSQLSLTLQKLFFMGTFPIFIVVDAFEALFKQGGTVEFVMRKK